MNLETIWKNIKNYFLNFVQSQLIVTLASVPILVGWGLQISTLTFIGNLVFAPILTLFLILSSIIFFTELVGIPNHFFIIFLESLTSFWHTILNTGTKSWLYGFCRPTTILLFLIPILAFLILLLIKHKTTQIKTWAMFGCFCISILGLNTIPSFFSRQHASNSFYDGKLLIEFDKDKNITLIDNGFFNTKSSPEKTIDYELKQYLIKNTGKPEIKNLVLLQPSYRTFKAAQELCCRLDVLAVTLPFFDKKISKAAQCQFFKLKQLLEEKQIAFLRTRLHCDKNA